MTAPFDLDAIEAKALSVSEELCARVEMKDPSLLSRFHPTERERAALFFRGARANTLRLVERIRELEAESIALGNLLAVIHRDGGHHVARVGVAQAATEAERLVVDVRAHREQETATIARLHETITRVTDVHARDLRRIADALDLNASDSWDADEITKLVRHERAARKSYEEGLAWETSCLHCAATLSSCRAAEERAEAAEAIIAGRTVAPTDAEIAVHDGPWLVSVGDLARFREGGEARDYAADMRRNGWRWTWTPFARRHNAFRPVAWPVVAETAK